MVYAAGVANRDATAGVAIMPLTHAKPVTFINTANRRAAESFYRDVLQLAFVADDGFAAVFDLGSAVLRITELEGYAASPHPALGWSVEDIEQTMEHLVSRGIAPRIYEGFGQDSLGIWTAPDGAARVAWFQDPDGNLLSVVQSG
ncbi:MAG: glyoxalase/bleomycin resistance/dioxygenase family protein [Blastomonas sp.]|jgi:catechol 2,3-dioxygenase-like lactoylglutathione lyase family enzyme|nr:glyoxalase/bleomycin resistance/dioxygenase family protein [Blastomonas sp.]|tara:strand:+ start:84812 stop:85246 length:435 start_codon:yes stop_codon:yes gene_type:complete